MGDVREIFSLPVDEDFVLSDHPTLNHFVSYIVKMKGGSEPTQPATPVPASTPSEQPVSSQTNTAEPTATETASKTRRWQVEVEPCPAVAEGLPIGGTIVLTQDSWGVADALATRLSAKGLSVAKVGFEFGAKSVTEQEELSGHTYRADPRQRTANRRNLFEDFRRRRNHSPCSTFLNRQFMGKRRSIEPSEPSSTILVWPIERP